MLIQHIGFRLKGLYKIARLANKWEAIMGTQAYYRNVRMRFFKLAIIQK